MLGSGCERLQLVSWLLQVTHRLLHHATEPGLLKVKASSLPALMSRCLGIGPTRIRITAPTHRVGQLLRCIQKHYVAFLHCEWTLATKTLAHSRFSTCYFKSSSFCSANMDPEGTCPTQDLPDDVSSWHSAFDSPNDPPPADEVGKNHKKLKKIKKKSDPFYVRFTLPLYRVRTRSGRLRIRVQGKTCLPLPRSFSD